MMIYADLHLHTNYSDGTQSIDTVLTIAKNKGIKVIAISDHDTIFHFQEVKKKAEELGLETIRAVEMSCYDFDVYKKVHIVGLWLNDNPKHVEVLCQNTLKCRDYYHKERIIELNKKGIDITYEEAKEFSPYNIVFKMHLFQAIVSKYPEYSNMQKYRELFAGQTSKQVDLQMGYINVKEGINAIHQDGGMAFLAHPCEYDNYDEIGKYVEFGLDGIEVSHPSMEVKDYPLTLDFANRFNLLKSGGSDFHDERMTIMGEFGLSEEQFNELKEKANK